MATLGATVLTLSDVAKRVDKTGRIGRIVEMLGQTNPLLEDMLWGEANEVTSELTTIRTGLPAVYWRLINQGLPPSKSKTAQVRESIGMLEAWSETDKDLVEMSGDPAGLRLSEASAFLEAMNQEMAQTLFYGNSSTAPQEFNGLAPRYSSLTGASNGANIINGGGVGSDNTSVWLIEWGDQTVKGVFPKGSKAGIDHEDLGLVTVETTAGVAGNRMRAYQDHWQWKAGLVVKDWRYAVRIANIDVSNLVANSSAADLTELMILAIHRLPSLTMGKPVFYMNRTAIGHLDIQRRNDVQSGGGLTYDMVDGKPVMSFRGIPIRATDALLETEATVS